MSANTPLTLTFQKSFYVFLTADLRVRAHTHVAYLQHPNPSTSIALACACSASMSVVVGLGYRMALPYINIRASQVALHGALAALALFSAYKP